MTATTAGGIPALLRFVTGASREMSGVARDVYNARKVGSLYVGMLFHRGLKDREKRKAFDLGRTLAEAIRTGG
ncbi:MAG: hypothetical protein V1748_08115 [Actinomycetota bacterium]